MKRIILVSSLLLGVIFLAGCGRQSESQTKTTAPDPIAQTPTQPTDESANWITYINTQYGFEFQYPVSWKKVAVLQAFSADYLPSLRNFVAIYPDKYPAQDFSARVDVYNVPLATVQRDNPFLKNLSSSTQTINGVSWTKMGDTDYLTEKNGKTYDVGGPADLTNQILSAFKFTNASAANNEPFSYATTGVPASVSKETAPFGYTADQLKSLAEECGNEQTASYYSSLVSKFSGAVKTVYNFKYTSASQESNTFVVTLLPNKAGYSSLDEFKKDFDQCYAGGDAYPKMLNSDWLLFVNSCGSGFDDGSGKPIGCQEVKDVVEPTLKLN